MTTDEISEEDLVQLFVADEEEQDAGEGQDDASDHLQSLEEQLRIVSTADLVVEHHSDPNDGFQCIVRRTQPKLKIGIQQTERKKKRKHISLFFSSRITDYLHHDLSSL